MKLIVTQWSILIFIWHSTLIMFPFYLVSIFYFSITLNHSNEFISNDTWVSNWNVVNCHSNRRFVECGTLNKKYFLPVDFFSFSIMSSVILVSLYTIMPNCHWAIYCLWRFTYNFDSRIWLSHLWREHLRLGYTSLSGNYLEDGDGREGPVLNKEA